MNDELSSSAFVNNLISYVSKGHLRFASVSETSFHNTTVHLGEYGALLVIIKGPFTGDDRAYDEPWITFGDPQLEVEEEFL